MDIKDTTILLIFLLSILGLIIGVYYTHDLDSDNISFERIHKDSDGIEIITLEKKENKNSDNDYLNSVFNLTPLTVFGR